MDFDERIPSRSVVGSAGIHSLSIRMDRWCPTGEFARFTFHKFDSFTFATLVKHLDPPGHHVFA